MQVLAGEELPPRRYCHPFISIRPTLPLPCPCPPPLLPLLLLLRAGVKVPQRRRLDLFICPSSCHDPSSRTPLPGIKCARAGCRRFLESPYQEHRLPRATTARSSAVEFHTLKGQHRPRPWRHPRVWPETTVLVQSDSPS